jgi:hypothetical protein
VLVALVLISTAPPVAGQSVSGATNLQGLNNYNNQQGWLKFLTGADQQEMNLANSTLQNMVRTECSSMNYLK